jgi:hypothetical protein
MKMRLLLVNLLSVCVFSCGEKSEDEDRGVPLPNGDSQCVTSQAEPRSNDGFVKWQVSGDYSGDLTYTCFKIPTLQDGDTDITQAYEDLAVVFNDSGKAGAYQDTVHFSFAMFRGFYEGLTEFRFCSSQNDETYGFASSGVKIRTPKLDDPAANSSTYDIWLHPHCDGDEQSALLIDSHDTENRRVKGHFDNVAYRTTDDSSKKISVSASFSFTYDL